MPIRFTKEGMTTTDLAFYIDPANPRSFPGSGNVWTDLAGRNNLNIPDITGSTRPGYDSGDAGGAFTFNGTNQICTYSTSSIQPANNFTMMAWVKPLEAFTYSFTETTTWIDGINVNNYVIQPHQATSPDSGAGFAVATNGVIVVEHSSGYAPTILVANTTIPSSSWSHVAITYTNKLPRCYLNGNLIRTAGAASTRSNIYIRTEQNLSIFGGIWDYFNGRVGIVQYYYRPLSATEILGNFNQHRRRYGV